jgi:RimJ/RimL family protein N-acetyltransferase
VVWYCREKYFDLDMNLTIQPGANKAWLFGAWVRRDLRGHGLYRELLQVVTAELKSNSIDTIWLGTDRSNWRSRAIHKHLEAMPAGVWFGGKVLGIGRYVCHHKPSWCL